MSKKIIGLLLALCLVVGLLPMAALAEEAKTVQIRILSWIDMTATEGGAATFLKNSSYQGYEAIKEGDTIVGYKDGGLGWTQVAGTENDWNVKFEWPAGGTPTVTLKNAKLDMMGDGGTVLYTKGTNAETGADEYKSKGSISAILPKNGYPTDIKVVLQGDNQVDVNYGIIRCSVGDNQYFKNVTIVGENGGKLTGLGRTFNLRLKSGYNLTVENATLDWAATGKGGESVPMTTDGGDITIKNSDITMNSENQVAISATGKLTITDSKVTASGHTANGSTTGSGAIQGKEGVVITNSEVTATAKKCVGIYGGTGGVEINSGKISVNAAEDGIGCAPDANIKVNGGTVEITARKAFSKAPILAAGIDGVAGVSADDADYYDDTKYGKAYVKLGTDVQAPAGTTPAGTTPNTPAGTTPNTPAQTTPNTPAGTTPAGTQGNNNPGTGDNGIVMFSALLLIAVFGIVATVAFGKKNSITE